MILELNRPLVIFDIESTGVNAQHDRIVELSAVKILPGGTREEKTWLLNPGIPIPPETTAIHGITDADVKDCPSFAEMSGDILNFFEGCDIGGFNCDRFDIPCLVAEFGRLGCDFMAEPRRQIDVQRIYHRMEPRDLTAAVQFYCHREHTGAHGATADAQATADVLMAQLERYPELPHEIGALDEYLVPHDPLNLDRQGKIRWQNGAWRINFGQERGAKLTDLKRNKINYLKWMLHSNFDADVRATVQKFLETDVLPPPPVKRNA